MKAYGKKKIRTSIAGHQNCGVCHPAQKNMKNRARQTGKKSASDDFQCR